MKQKLRVNCTLERMYELQNKGYFVVEGAEIDIMVKIPDNISLKVVEVTKGMFMDEKNPRNMVN